MAQHRSSSSRGHAIGPRTVGLIENDTALVHLWYPRSEDRRVKAVEVHLIDVRAADGIRVTYDFDRDGWSVQQASTFSWPADDPVCDPDWQEVAFVQAWARQKEEEQG